VNIEDIHITSAGDSFSVRDLLDGKRGGEEKLAALGRDLFERLNPGLAVNDESAVEWIRYLRLLASGCGDALLDPYSELPKYRIEPISRDFKHVHEIPLIRQIDSPSPEARTSPAADRSAEDLSRTLFVMAIGGADTTFYDGMPPDAIEAFLRDFLPPECSERFGQALLRQGVPRAFASKADGRGGRVTLAESLIAQAYASGIRHAAVLTHAAAAPAIAAILHSKFGKLRDLRLTVTVQPLLPSPAAADRKGHWIVSPETGGFPGGHGHGFKYTLLDPTVREWIREGAVDSYLFSNGDNAALFSRGPDPFVQMLAVVRRLREKPEYARLRVALVLVWESFQKGGFAFFLRHRKTHEKLGQVFEVELAVRSGVALDSLRKIRGGYNTNAAVGFLDETFRWLDRLPLALKEKRIGGIQRLLFEASFATAMTTFQDEEGISHFEPRSAMLFLAPDSAPFPHWMHLSLRKREDWLAYASSLFKAECIKTQHGLLPVFRQRRDSTLPFPRLEGDVARSDVLNSGQFFELFRSASIDFDGFSGSLRIDFPAHWKKRRGTLRFEGSVIFSGEGTIAFEVPAGEDWVIRDRTFRAPIRITSMPSSN
jgi:hypothetical protein